MKNLTINTLSKISRGVKKLVRILFLEGKETLEMCHTGIKWMSHDFSDNVIRPTNAEINKAWIQLKDIPKIAPFFIVFFIPIPGMVEIYVLGVLSLEKLVANNIRLLPTQFYEVQLFS